jgi:protein-disulfide isomerase
MFGNDKNAKMLTVLIGLTLVVTLVNSYGIFSLNGRLGTTGNVAAMQELKQADPQPTQQQPAQQPTQQQQTAPATVSADDDAVMGDASAPVEIIEFSDYQCPYCGRFFSETLGQIEDEYISTGKVKLVYRDFPLSFHPQAQKAAEAAECAGEQGKYFEMHDMIFSNQQSIQVADLKGYASVLGLDQNQFDTCLDSGKYESEVKQDFQDGAAAGVSGTPTFFINGVKVVGAQPYSAFKQIIDQQLA